MSDAVPLARERRGRILVARLDRPDARNALSSSLIKSLGAAMLEAESDPGIRAVVLTGTGDRAFCAGMDLRSFANEGQSGLGDDNDIQGFYRLLGGKIRLPVIGAANGTALAGGLELLLGCDVIVASSEATFGLPEVKRGLFPAGNGTSLSTRIPMSVALEMTMTGESIDATRAYALGLVNSVVSPEDVLPTAIDYAERIAANGPLGVAAAKELTRLAVSDPERASERQRELQVAVFSSHDAKEGAMAFVEKRAPVWRGE